MRRSRMKMSGQRQNPKRDHELLDLLYLLDLPLEFRGFAAWRSAAGEAPSGDGRWPGSSVKTGDVCIC
jgi:hypothetical protein